nr:hypothetical protein [Tanacetum cinerariifolium]
MVKNLDNVNNFLMYPRFVQVFVDKQRKGMSNHNRNTRRVGKGFSGRETHLFPTMMVQAQEEICEGSANPTDPYHTPTIIQPSISQPQKKQKPRKTKRKDTKLPRTSGPTTNVADEAVNKEMDDSLVRAATTASSLEAEHNSGNISKTQSNATPNKSSSQGTDSGGGPSDEDSLKLKELMELCTTLQSRVLALEQTKATQANKIDSLKRRVKKLENKQRLRTHKLKRLYKVSLTARVESSDDNEDLDLHSKEVFVTQQDENVIEKEVVATQVQVTTGATTPTISIDKVTLAQALVELKHTKSKVKVKGIVFYEPEESTTTTLVTELVEECSKKANAEVMKGSLKIVGTELEQESSKKQKIDDDKDTTKLKQLVKIIPDEEGVAIDAIPFSY